MRYIYKLETDIDWFRERETERERQRDRKTERETDRETYKLFSLYDVVTQNKRRDQVRD